MKRVLIVMQLCLFSAVNVMAQTLTFSVDDYCPYYCKDQHSAQGQLAKKPGFVVEILEYAFRNKGYEIEYVFRPWARGIREVTEGTVNGLLIASVDDAPRHVFPQNEQGRSMGCYYTSANNTWRFNGVSSLKGMELGLVKGYAYSEPLNSFLKHNAKNLQVLYLTGENPMARILNMIKLGRLDATMADANIADFLIHKMGKNSNVKKVGCSKDFLNFYVTFSPMSAKSKIYAKVLSDAMDELRMNGQLDTILNKYGVDDWN